MNRGILVCVFLLLEALALSVDAAAIARRHHFSRLRHSRVDDQATAQEGAAEGDEDTDAEDEDAGDDAADDEDDAPEASEDDADEEAEEDQDEDNDDEDRRPRPALVQTTDGEVSRPKKGAKHHKKKAHEEEVVTIAGYPVPDRAVDQEDDDTVFHVKPPHQVVHALVKAAEGKTAKTVQNLSQAPAPAAVDIDSRPNLGGDPEMIQFGILAKTFYGMDFKQGTFTMDAVMTLKWTDNRTSALVPQGKDSITLGQDDAATMMWMPDISVTNRNLKGVDVISTAITVASGGKVTKIERFLSVTKNGFDPRAFPFDTQHLKLRIASTTLMSDELQLVPLQGEKDLEGCADGVFDGKDVSLINAEIRSYDEVNGALKKSRGELDIHIERDSEAYFHTMLLPELILIGISWTVFMFPLLPPFIMPRVATAMIAYMALTTFMFRTGSMLPTRGGSSWIDVFEECSQILMFSVLILNIFVEALHHEFKQVELSDRIQWEVRVFFPVVVVVVYAIIFLFAGSLEHLGALEWTTRIFLFLCIGGYIGWNVFRFIKLRNELRKEGAGV